jgi:hypothetical protein
VPDKNDLRDQSRSWRSAGENVRVRRSEDDVGGKHISRDDTIFVFASENEGGPGLVASGVVASAKAIAKKRGIARQTPRVSISIRGTALAKRRLGRSELKRFCDWNDDRPETELNFKFYRQATNKIVGISDKAAAFLRGFF